MDALKKEIERKRKALSETFAGRQFVRRSEIEQKQIQKIRQEEQKELQEKAGRAPSSSDSASGSSPTGQQCPETVGQSKKNKTDLEDERKLDDLVLPRVEVIRRLRYLKQPITLFGEDDDTRLSRLKALLKAGVTTNPDNELMEGQRNDFLMDLTDLKKKEKNGLLNVDRRRDKQQQKDQKRDGEDDGGNVEHGVNDPGGDGGSSGLENDKDSMRMKTNFEDLCDEDKILVFFKRLLQEWEHELEERPEAEKRSGKGKSSFATFKQCARYLNPLFKICRKKILPDDIRQALLIIVNRCMEKNYLSAMDQYIKLAIGNAPWPIGVTMVGIHERSAREKIYTNSVAHIMNDETTRKYLQSVKRLMTLCQRRYPSVPSKSVEFNSLANGSDLQSLLTEEESRKNATQERLRLTVAENSFI